MTKEQLNKWAEWCAEQHRHVNQYYGGKRLNLPYSFHLRAVAAQVEAFRDLLDPAEYEIARVAAYGHDLLEDTNLNYNDIIEVLNQHDLNHLSKLAAETIYRVTDEKGRSRAERKNAKYYEELTQGEVALYVKLCDIIANKMFSRLTGSGMYRKYQQEHQDFYDKTYNKRFAEMYSYLESL